MGRHEPADPAVRAAWTRERRRAAAAHHPDLGGDMDSYLGALAAVDRAYGVRGHPVTERVQGAPARAELEVRRTWRGSRMRAARRTRRVLGAVRKRLPRSLPGARRTTEI